MSNAYTQRVTDLCIAINAVEGTQVAPEYEKQNKQVCKTLYECMMTEADTLYSNGQATLKDLTEAINAAGWEDQKMVRAKYELKIVEA
jgi:hypothetical protein